MNLYLRHFLTFLACALLFASCHSVPDHARYIPKDATAVVGVNTNVLSKKIAWSAITGSKLLEELEKGAGDAQTREKAEALKDAGISYNSTLYFYQKADNRYQNDSKMGLVLPLSSDKKWEEYLKKNFTNSVITDHKDFKTAMLDDYALAGWNGNVLIIQNPLRLPVPEAEYDPSDTDGVSMPMTVEEAKGKIDAAGSLAEMQNAFAQKKENSIAKDDHFQTLSKQNDDIALFLNYEQVMNTMNGLGMGAAMTQPMFQNTAMTVGINFKDGLIESDMRYYPSENMKEVVAQLGSKDVDKDLVDRLPGDNLGMVMTYHLDPKALSTALDKMGMTGLVNLSLASQGLNMDEILSAFTGDLGFTINNFRVEQQRVEVDSFMLTFMDTADLIQQTPVMDFLFVMKIKNKATVDKLMGLAQKSGVKSMGNGLYQISDDPETAQLLVSNDYIMAGNRAPSLQAFSGNKTPSKLPQPALDVVKGHPFSWYVDMQTMLKNVPAGAGRGKHAETAMLEESRKMFRTIEFTGGEFSKNASTYKMKVNLMDKKENALLQLLNMIQQVAAANQLDEQERQVETTPAEVLP